MNKNKKLREDAYQKALVQNPLHADGLKRLIFTDAEEKDNYGLIPKVIGIRVDLKYIATHVDDLMDDEIQDLQYLLKSQLGKKKLCKVFTK